MSIIDARVIQKVGTEAEWNANELILLKGEIALVAIDDLVVNMKVGNGTKKFRELPYMQIGDVSNYSIKPTDTSAVLNALPNAVYRAFGEGTYNFNPSLQIVQGSAVNIIPPGYSVKFLKDASGWSVNTVEKLPMQDLTIIESNVNHISQDLNNIKSSNIVDKTKIIKGRYNSNGVGYDSNAVNWISYPLIDLQLMGINEGDSFSIHGLKSGGTRNLFSFFVNNSISGETAQIVNIAANTNSLTTTRPVGKRYLGITLENTTGVGDNITSAVCYNTVMLNKGGVIPYEGYGARVDLTNYAKKSELTPLATKSEVNYSVNNFPYTESDVNQIIDDNYDINYYYNGVNSKSVLSQTYNISSNGDYVEFIAKWESGLAFQKGLSLLGLNNGQSFQTLGFYSNTQIRFRAEEGSDYIIFDGLPSVSTEFKKYKVAISEDGNQWQLYVNGVLTNSQPRVEGSVFSINTIGNAYGSTLYQGYVKSLEIKSNGNIYNLSNINRLNNFSVVKNFVKKSNEGNGVGRVFYEFNPTGYEGRELLIVYVQRGNTNSYIGHHIAHEYDMRDITYKDLYRIIYAHEYILNDNSMIKQSNYTLYEGESECVYKGSISAIDHTGGIHGDEIYEKFEFYVDGVKQNKNNRITLKECKEVYYIQKSKTYKTAEGTSSNPIIDHKEDALHYKRTVFSNSSYTTYNTLKWLRAFKMEYWYQGIACIGKIQASVAQNEVFEDQDMIGADLSQQLALPAPSRQFSFYSNVNKKSAEVIARITNNNDVDNNSYAFCWDREFDSKYYRKTYSVNTVIGDELKSEMIVKYL